MTETILLDTLRDNPYQPRLVNATAAMSTIADIAMAQGRRAKACRKFTRMSSAVN